MSPPTNWSNRPDPIEAGAGSDSPKGFQGLCPTVGGRAWSTCTGCLKGPSSAVCSNSDQDRSTQTWSSSTFFPFSSFFCLSLEWQGHDPLLHSETWRSSFPLSPSSQLYLTHHQILPILSPRYLKTPLSSHPCCH